MGGTSASRSSSKIKFETKKMNSSHASTISNSSTTIDPKLSSLSWNASTRHLNGTAPSTFINRAASVRSHLFSTKDRQRQNDPVEIALRCQRLLHKANGKFRRT